MENLRFNSELNAGVLLFAATVNLFLILGLLPDIKKEKRRFLRSFIILLSIGIIMLLGEAGLWIYEKPETNKVFLGTLCLMSYGGGALMFMTFAKCIVEYIREKADVSYRPAYFAIGLGILYLIAIIASLFCGEIFDLNFTNGSINGKYSYFYSIYDGISLALVAGLPIYYRKYLQKKELTILLSFSLMIVPLSAVSMVIYPVPAFLAATLSMILLFTLYHNSKTRLLMEQERLLLESRLDTAISQIQPHFIYNTLSTISELCEINPKKAEEVTVKFSEYLRGNLDNMGNLKPVMFDKELEHIKNYLWIEQMRFGEDLNIEYDIKVHDFQIPSLAIQPLIENAIKHGFAGCEDAFTIKIKTEEFDKYYCIIIEDDGAGFDMDKKLDDSKSHVGLENVKNRLEIMVGGTLKIDSSPGNGCRVEVRIPKDEIGVGVEI